jgi:phenylpropionate dioxygenase-like ring-hydroxylating dioxygenase large terminal subunit
MVWAVLDPGSDLDIAAFLGRYAGFLEVFGFEDWTLVNRRVLKGPNWKLCFDAHLEFYHLPVLHRNTFGPDMDPRALYYHYGPHQRLARPARSRPAPDGLDIFALQDRPAADWPLESLLFGEWILFPNVSINTFYSGGRGVILSQIIPGASVDTSETIQLFLMEGAPSEEDRALAVKTAEFLAHVVGEEDLPTSEGQQRVLRSGLLDRVAFGRNEGGLQHFHRWVDRIAETPKPQLNALFASAEAPPARAPALA